MTENKTDEQLLTEVRRSAEGDFRAFETLVSRYQGRILANCRYLTRSLNDAEDLAQEVFVKAYFGLARFEGRSSFRTWLQRIKINHCFNFMEKKKGKAFVDVEDPAIQDAPGLRVESNAERALRARRQRKRIGDVLDSLNDTLRIPLIMRDLDDFSYDEIADRLGIGLSAVKMRIKRAREEFRAQWETDARPAGSGEAPKAERTRPSLKVSVPHKSRKGKRD